MNPTEDMLNKNTKILRDMIKADIKFLKQRIHRRPTKAELLDHLFSKNRYDEEAKLLEKRLQRVLNKYLK